MQKGLSLKNLPLTPLTQLSKIQEPQAGCGCGCILFCIKAGLSKPPSASLPSWIRKTGVGKPFWKKTCAYQSPSSFRRAGSCLNCPSLHTDPGTPGNGQEGAFWGCSVPHLPPEPILPQALCLRDTVPLPRGSRRPVGTECPARPPAGEHRQGLLFLVRTRIFHSSPHSHTPGCPRARGRG